MHTPTKQQWQTVIDNLKKVLPMAANEHHLDMGENRVNGHYHKCGTIHCVGGWYAVSVCDLTEEIDFNDGGEAMANHIGFDDRHRLAEWAYLNPEIWGNEHGDMMFYDNKAYDGAKTLTEVIAHLEGVRDRSPE